MEKSRGAVKKLVQTNDDVDGSYWAVSNLVVDICTPIVSLLRLVEGAGACIGKVYHRSYLVQQHMKMMMGDKAAADEQSG